MTTSDNITKPADKPAVTSADTSADQNQRRDLESRLSDHIKARAAKIGIDPSKVFFGFVK